MATPTPMRELVGLNRTAIRRAPGSTVLSSWGRFPTVSSWSLENPVTFPPGRARLATRPIPTGSLTNMKTIGIVELAFLAASAGRVPLFAMIRSTLRPTRSAANAGEQGEGFFCDHNISLLTN